MSTASATITLQYDRKGSFFPWFDQVNTAAMAVTGLAQIAMSTEMLDATLMTNPNCNSEWRSVSIGSILFDQVVVKHISVQELYAREASFVASGATRESLSLGDKGRYPLLPRAEGPAYSVARDNVSDFRRNFDQYVGYILSKISRETIDVLNLNLTFQAAKQTKDVIALIDAIKFTCMKGEDDEVTARMDYENYLRDPMGHGHGQDGSIDGYIQNFTAMYSMLRGAGSTMSNELVVAGFIKGLDESYNDLKTVLATTGAPSDLPKVIDQVRKHKANKRMFSTVISSPGKISQAGPGVKRTQEVAFSPADVQVDNPSPAIGSSGSNRRWGRTNGNALKYPSYSDNANRPTVMYGDALGDDRLDELEYKQRELEDRERDLERAEYANRVRSEMLTIFATTAGANAYPNRFRNTAGDAGNRPGRCRDWDNYGRCVRLEKEGSCRYEHVAPPSDQKSATLPAKKNIFGSP
jgi:hypothetical protein